MHEAWNLLYNYAQTDIENCIYGIVSVKENLRMHYKISSTHDGNATLH